MISKLNTIKMRIWKENKWPLVTEVELNKTRAWTLEPYQYYNYTFWPWMTAVEVLARSKFAQFEECNLQSITFKFSFRRRLSS